MTVKQYIFKYIRDNVFKINEILAMDNPDKEMEFNNIFQQDMNETYSMWRGNGSNRYIKDIQETYWFRTKLGNDIMVTRKGKTINVNFNPKITKI